MLFHPKKCFFIAFNSRGRPPKIMLGDIRLTHVKSHRYLGVLFSNYLASCAPLTTIYRKRPFGDFVSNSISKAKKALSGCKSVGYHADGLRPLTALRLFKALVRPHLEFASQLVFVSDAQVVDLEKFQASACRSLLGLPLSCPRPVCRLVAGLPHPGLRRDILALRFWLRLHEAPPGGRNTVLGALLCPGGVCPDPDSLMQGYHRDIALILKKHNLQHLWTRFPHSEVCPKALKIVITSGGFSSDKILALQGGSLYARFLLPKISRLSPLPLLSWLSRDIPRSHRDALIKGLLHNHSLKRKCPFCAFRAPVRVSGQPCPLFEHQLTACPALAQQRGKVSDIIAQLPETLETLLSPTPSEAACRLAAFFAELRL